MGQNLKDLFKDEIKNEHVKMSQGHEARFVDKLEMALPETKTSNFKFLNIAASIVVLLGLSYGAFQFLNVEKKTIKSVEIVETKPMKTMGDISPDLKKVEDYYLASIHLELSKVNLTSQNKELVDGYIDRLQELNTEYEKLTIELNDNGVNEETLNALIDNLKFRLNLVMRLKDKLQEFNNDVFEEKSI